MALLLAATLSGCGQEREVSRIEPPSASQEVNNPELGSPAVEPLSFGPGDKDSPTWSPSGERVAFVVDGYVSDKALPSESATRRTIRELGAERVTWPPGEQLAILGKNEPAGSESGAHTHPLYVTRGDEGQLGIESLTKDALAVSSPSGDEPLVAALESGPHESRISVVDVQSGELEVYPNPVEGLVTEISVAPGGGRALAAMIATDGSGSEWYEIYTFDLETGESRRIARLPGDQEILGAPQQTSDGIYYVAGARENGDGSTQDNDIQYTLYRLPEGSPPSPASGVGRDFVASSIKASPDGERLALLGRRDSASATNLYVLDLSDGSLYSATNNENMEIKTGTDSLDWHPGGGRVAIVARSDISEPKVYRGSASSLLANFYNLYEIPVDDLREEG